MHPASPIDGASPLERAARRDTKPFDRTSVGTAWAQGVQPTPALRRIGRTNVVLLELLGAEPGAVFSATPRGASLGRAESGGLVLRDATVSAVHANVRVEDGIWVIRDCRVETERS